MVKVCFYFQAHQPYRIREYSIFDIGKNSAYFHEQKNREILKKVANKCYLPMNAVLSELLRKHPEFKVSFSFSGVLLEQLEKEAPEALKSFQDLVKTGRVEILGETYYHSLSFLYSKDEFVRQVRLHAEKVKKIFGVNPKVFRNTELIYNNELAKWVEDLGYSAILAEGADHVLQWRSPNFVYKPQGAQKMRLLLKNYKLSDDIAFRFSNRGWEQWPLTAEKFAQWVGAFNGSGEVINLFMDYETFGEHQWPDTGIFDFMRRLPREILKHPDNSFVTPAEAAKLQPVAELDIPYLVSWADIERDVSAWTGNEMQRAALAKIYEIEKAVQESGDAQLLEDWRKLQTSDHFYYMCTKWFADGDVHKYFNPYESPYDGYLAYMNILNDVRLRLEAKHGQEA